MDDNKAKAPTAALQQIEKQFGKGSIMKMGEAEIDEAPPGQRLSPCHKSSRPSIGGALSTGVSLQ